MSVGILLYTGVATRHSRLACQAFPQCVVFAHRLNFSGDRGCPCISLVDRHRVTALDEWLNLTDATQVVATLAAEGYLQTLQIMNRHLPTLPDEMATCTGLQDMYDLICTSSV